MSPHLSDLDYDRLVLGDATELPRIEAHLAECSECRAGIETLRAQDARFALAPTLPVQAAARGRRSRLPFVAVAGALVAIAAALLIVTRPREPDDHLVVKGGALDFEVHIADDAGTRRVDDGATVHAGERAGFGVRASAAGYLMIVGWDDTQAIYVALPEKTQPAEARAVAVAASTDVQQAPAAVRFDARLGSETLAAIYCQASFALAELAPELRVTSIDALKRSVGERGCAIRTIALHKQAR